METQTTTLRPGVSRLRHLAMAGVLGPPVFVAVFLLAGWLRPGYSAMSQEVSALGVGPTSWLQNTNFVVFGVLLVLFAAAFAGGMRGELDRPLWLTIVSLLVLSGTGVVLSGLFTMAGTAVVHWLGGFVLAFLPAIAVCFLAAVHLRHDPRWHSYARYSLAVSITALVIIAGTFVFLNPAFPELNRFGGLLQRLLVVVVFSWHVLFGWRLWRLGAKQQQRQ